MSDIPTSQTGALPADPLEGGAAPTLPVIPAAPVPALLTPEQEATAARIKVRVWSAFVLAICASMLLVGLWLKPDQRGVETHTQIGLLPCGFMRVFKVPCPTCGCTTAVSHFSHGNLARSLYTQPFGFAVALLATILVPLTAVGVATGRWLGPSMFWLNWYWWMWVYGGLLLLLGAWGYKVWLVWVGLSG